MFDAFFNNAGLKRKVILSWSGGKDSALSLYKLKANPDYEVVGLLTTVLEKNQSVAMHNTSLELIEQQASSLELPLYKVLIPANDHNEYGRRMRDMLLFLKSQRVNYIAFGDIFLEDLRQYRENKLAEVDFKAIFPLWGKNSVELIKEFIDLGFKTVITNVDTNCLDIKYVGKTIDQEILSSFFSSSVDVCGEKGEYHSFVYDGPIFKTPIQYAALDFRLEDNFYICNLLPETAKPSVVICRLPMAPQ